MHRFARTIERLLREEGGWTRVFTPLAMAICLGAAAVAYHQSTAPGGGAETITCDLSSTNSSDFTSDLSAATSGDTICLTNAVDYGTFNGTSKDLTIVAQSGTGAPDPVNATLAIIMGSGDNGTVVIDGGRDTWDAAAGLNIPTAEFSTGAANLTIKDFEIDGTGGSGRRWIFDPAPVDSNILIDHFNAHDVLGGEALFYVEPPSGAAGQDTGITIQRGILHHISNDGVKLGGEFVIRILNNKFMDFHESLSGDGNHTDGIQPLVTKHAIIKGNWLTNADQCLFGDDGTGSLTITHNVIDNCGEWTMYIGGDGPTGSTIAYNTITDRTYNFADGFTCGNNAVTGPFGATMDRSVPDLQNNIFQSITLSEGGGLDCEPVANHHNMLRTGESTTGVGGSNFTGSQVYVGGSDLSTFDEFSDWCLDPSSEGYNDATDGGEVGVCGGDYDGTNYGPPTGEGY